MNQRWILLCFLTPFKGAHEFCYKKSSDMLMFCIIYYRDNIYDISLFGKFLPSRLNKPNSLSTFYLEWFGADLSEIKLFQHVSILLTGMSTTSEQTLKCLHELGKTSSFNSILRNEYKIEYQWNWKWLRSKHGITVVD